MELLTSTLDPLIVPSAMHVMSVLLLLAVTMKLTVFFFPPPGKSEGVLVIMAPGILQLRVTVAP